MSEIGILRSDDLVAEHEEEVRPCEMRFSVARAKCISSGMARFWRR